jgi:starch synthase
MAFEIWMAAAEVAPVRRFLPAYGFIPRRGFTVDKEKFSVPLGNGKVAVKFLSRKDPSGVTTTLVDCPEMFAREGIYGTDAGEYPDNPRRFTLFCRAICELAHRKPHPPAILHGHDWQASLIPLLIRYAYEWKQPPRTVFTIHNLAYQGRYPADEIDAWSLEARAKTEVFTPAGVEFYNQVNFMKASLVYADRVTTVSPTYAREILTPEFGEELEGVLSARKNGVVGILNGADYDVWNPSADKHIPRKYTLKTVREGKAAAQKDVREALRISKNTRPLVAVVGRFASQKGIDILLHAVPDLIPLGIDMAVLGSGELAYAAEFQNYRIRYPERVGLVVRYDDPLSHRILAAADYLLLPSRYEPCGLSQLHALRYGTTPIVHKTGGLIDTVVDPKEFPQEATGFTFDELHSQAVVDAVSRALEFRKDNPAAFEAMRARGMNADFSWARSAKQYAEIYRDLAG